MAPTRATQAQDCGVGWVPPAGAAPVEALSHRETQEGCATVRNVEWRERVFEENLQENLLPLTHRGKDAKNMHSFNKRM